MINCRAKFILFAITVFLIQGCSEQKHDQRAQDGPQQAPPSATQAENAYKSRSTEFPAEFPLPKYPNSEVEVSQLKLSRTPAHQVMLKTSDTAQKVFHFYTKVFRQDDWDIGKVTNNQGYMMITASKNGARANVLITETRSGVTAISLYSDIK
jgi:hypothetical protein